MECTTCQKPTRKNGKNRNGSQRYRCDDCRATFTDETTRPTDGRKLAADKAILALRMLLEGNSIRSTERLLEIHRDTIIKAMVRIGEQCAVFMHVTQRGIKCNDVEIDEIWGWVGMKERAKKLRKIVSENIGDAYCFTAMERTTKLMLTHYVGPRNQESTDWFMGNLSVAVDADRCQYSTDGFPCYPSAFERFTDTHRADYAIIHKEYGKGADDHKYSPPRVVGVQRVRLIGMPNPDMICTSHVERSNLTLRMQIRRLTRLTNAFSKKLRNHKAALALFFAYYNYCRVHMTLKTTPAVAAGLTDHVWSVTELVATAAKNCSPDMLAMVADGSDWMAD